jgi:steroid delta-isomerase-like uncharacterized protein
MSEENKAILTRLYDEVNKHSLDGFDDLMDDGFVEHEDLPGLPPGKEGVKAFFGMLYSAFPDLQMVPNFITAEGDIAAAFVTVTGTQNGEFMGMPPSGKSATVHISDWMRIKDGKVTEHWGVMDMASLMQQLGAGAP